MNKPSKNILILSFVLFFMHAAKAQNTQSNFLKQSSVAFGVTFSKMLGDSIFDQDLGRPSIGYYYNYPVSDKVDIDFGGIYHLRGAKSFNEDIYQTFAYLDMPIKANYIFSNSFKMGLGVQPSYLIFNQTRRRGVRSLITPMPYEYSPKDFDFNVVASFDLRLSNFSTFTFYSSYAPNSTNSSDVVLKHGQLGFQIKVGFGSTVKAIEKQSIKSRGPEIELVRLTNGNVLVCLSTKNNTAKYYNQKGDTAQANSVLKDARLKNKRIKEAFKAHYNYSKVYFITTEEQSRICNGNFDVLVEDINSQKVKFSTIANEFYVFFKPGSIYGKPNSFSKEGYHFLNKDCRKLADPFPSNDFAAANFTSDFNALVKELNKRLKSREAYIRSKKYFSTDLLNP